jgi:TonB-linked SusC/RagA family outer membrane protein
MYLNALFKYGKRRRADVPKIVLVMQLTSILLVAACLHVSASAFGQKITINEKEVSLREVFREIRKQTGYNFIYKNEIIEKALPVTLNLKNASIQDVLNLCFQHQPLTYLIDDKIIIVKPRPPLPLLQVTPGRVIIGTVKDSLTNLPLTGVTIQLRGTETGTVTDAHGAFQLNVPQGAILVVSYLGYESKTIAVGNRSRLEIRLQAGVSSLNQLVVIGYGTTSRKNLTTAVSTVDPSQVPSAANNSIPELLFGRAPGLQASEQSAEPGGNINLAIRGRGAPLIVVDGVVMPYSGLEPGNGSIAGELNGVHRGGFEGINPDDIASIDILKDASASIYGVNASNGVILITTKKGKEGKLRLNYDGSKSWVINMPYLKPLDARGYMTYYDALTEDQYLITNKMAPFGQNAASGFVPKYSSSDIEQAGTGTHWLDQVLRNGSIDNHNLSVSGGNNFATYYFSGGFFNQVGTMKSSGLRKVTGRMNLSFNFNKYVTLNVTATGARDSYLNSTAGWQTGGSGTQGFGALQAALAYPATVPVRDANGKYTLFQIIANPVSLLDIRDRTAYSSLMTNVSADFHIIPGVLTAKLLYGNNAESATRNFYIPSTTFYFQMFQARGSYNEAKRQNQTMEATLSFKKQISNTLNLDAVGGIGQYIYDDYGFGSQGSGMMDAIGTNNLASATNSIGITSYKDYTKTRSYFARTSLNFKQKYILSLSYRYDGFSDFFPQSKFAGFPSVSAAWKVTEESFMKSVTWLNFLKLRASIGITGNASALGANIYGSFSPDDYVISYNNGGINYIPYTLTSTNHPDVTWPKTINKDIGLDFSLVDDRISGSVDWFRDDLTRLLTLNTTDPLSLIPTEPVNAGHQVRQGYEIALNSTNVRTKSFEWTTVINMSHLHATWSKRFPNSYIPDYMGITDPINEIYAYKTKGILQGGETAPAWQPSGATMPGNPVFQDLDGDGKLDSGDVVRYAGDPKITIGFGNSFSYKNFDLSIFFYGQWGAWGYDYNSQWADPQGLLAGNQSGIVQIKDVWTTSNTSGTRPGVAYNELALGLPAGTNLNLEKTDFLRCRNITLGYTIHSPRIDRIFHQLNVYADVQNAFLITGYKIGDPELEAQNIKGGPAPYPMARTYSLGVKVSL